MAPGAPEAAREENMVHAMSAIATAAADPCMSQTGHSTLGQSGGPAKGVGCRQERV